MNREDLIKALEEAEERYLNNCNTPQVRGREMIYCDVIVDFVADWLLFDCDWPCSNLKHRWREEMGT